MLTVRFPGGVAVQYDAAHYLLRDGAGWHLYTAAPDKGGQWVASIELSAGAVVEAVGACRIENPAAQLTGERAVEEVAQHIREYGRRVPKLVATLKRELAAFDARRMTWKD